MAITGGIVLAAAATDQSRRQGRANDRAQREGLRQQETAQRTAIANAVRQQRQAEMAEKAANAKKPDALALLDSERTGLLTGASSTFLTGVDGAGKGMLGRPSLLGG
jgi:hypothetical protein